MLTFPLSPMATAPRPSVDGTNGKLMVLDEFQDGPVKSRRWALVYWLDAFEGRPAGWYGDNCTDLRNPVGWVMSTDDIVLPPEEGGL